MGEGLLKIFVWMPKVETFCVAEDLECGAGCAVFCYFFLSLFAVIKPILTIGYHHESETVIAYIQFVFAYIAAFCGFFAFYIALPMCFNFKDKGKDAPFCNIRNNTFSQIFILLCLILSLCEMVWGICTLARAFIEPGLLKLSNASTNPYPKYEKCWTVGSDGHRTRRRRTTCRPLTDDEIRMRKQWDIDHANDSVVYKDSQPFDGVLSILLTVSHLYALYPLVVFRSRLLEDLEEQDENAQSNE